MANKDDTTKPKPHPLAHVSVVDMTKLLPEDLHAEYSMLLGIKFAVKRLKGEWKSGREPFSLNPTLF